MVPQGPPAPLGGGQPVPSSLLRSSSGLLGGQGVGFPSQNSFSSLVSPCYQFNNVSMLSNSPNVASLLHQSFGNGGSGAGTSGQGLVDGGVEPDPLSGVETGVGLNHPSSYFISSSVTAIPNSSGQVQGKQHVSHASGNQMLTNQQRGQQIDPQDSEHNQQQVQQYSVPSNPQQQSLSKQQQQKFHALRNGLGGAGPVKLESPVTNEQASQLQNLRNLGPVNLDPQQLQQQRLMQFQHQQQLLKSMPQQRPPLQPQFQQQNLPVRSPIKPVYEPGMCARRLQHYMYQQQHRPVDNNIEFWRKFVEDCFAPNAKKKWCVSMYGSGRQTTGVFPQDAWHCEICNRRPGRGFEATVEVLPRLFRIKYESGTLEELLYVDMPREYQNSSGQIVLDYAKAIQESVFEQLRVVREGQLRIVFSPDLKICSWEFCARRHEELIPRKLLIPQVSQLGAAAQKCQTATQNASSHNTVSELQNNCTMFVASARQLAKALEVPLVNDLGYTKRYVRCLQISEVVNSMKDLIDYSRATGMGPMESLTKFPRRSASSSGTQGQSQQHESQVHHHQQTLGQNSKNDPSNQPSGNNSVNTPTTSSAGTPVGLLHENSFNSRQQNPTGANSPYGGNNVQMLSPGSSNALPQPQPAPSPYHSPAPSLSNNRPLSHGVFSGTHLNSMATPNTSMQQPSPSGDASDAIDSQSSVQKILRDMTMSYQPGGIGMMGSSTKNINGMLPASSDTSTILVGNGVANGNASVSSAGFGGIANGLSHPAIVHGSDSSMNGRGGTVMSRKQGMNQQHLPDSANHLLSGLGAGNGFDNLPFDWKASP